MVSVSADETPESIGHVKRQRAAGKVGSGPKLHSAEGVGDRLRCRILDDRWQRTRPPMVSRDQVEHQVSVVGLRKHFRRGVHQRHATHLVPHSLGVASYAAYARQGLGQSGGQHLQPHWIIPDQLGLESPVRLSDVMKVRCEPQITHDLRWNPQALRSAAGSVGHSFEMLTESDGCPGHGACLVGTVHRRRVINGLARIRVTLRQNVVVTGRFRSSLNARAVEAFNQSS